MTQKRFKKLLMGYGVTRNDANVIVGVIQKDREFFNRVGATSALKRSTYSAVYRSMSMWEVL